MFIRDGFSHAFSGFPEFLRANGNQFINCLFTQLRITLRHVNMGYADVSCILVFYGAWWFFLSLVFLLPCRY